MITRKSQRVFVTIIMAIVTLIVAYPMILLLMLSCKTLTEITLDPLALPTHIQWSNFSEAFKVMNYPRVLYNTLMMTVGASALALFGSAMAAWAVMRAPRMRKLFQAIYYVMLLGYILPDVSGLITMTLWLKKMHMNNTLIGIIFVFAGGSMSYGVFLISRFISTIPISLEESAMIDGATPCQTFFKISFPLLQPALVTFVIVRSVFIWNDFLTPLVLMQGADSRTMSLAIYFFKGEFLTEWNLLFAGLILSMIPVIVLYLIFQKRIVGGLTTGAVKI